MFDNIQRATAQSTIPIAGRTVQPKNITSMEGFSQLSDREKIEFGDRLVEKAKSMLDPDSLQRYNEMDNDDKMGKELNRMDMLRMMSVPPLEVNVKNNVDNGIYAFPKHFNSGEMQFFQASNKKNGIGGPGKESAASTLPYTTSTDSIIPKGRTFTIFGKDYGLNSISNDVIPGTPRQYVDAIKKKAAENGVPASILSALLSHESSFNASAENVNKREASYGLAQINTKAHNVTKEQAKDPLFAIDFAAKRLGDMIKKYGLFNGIQAYNTPGAVGSKQLIEYATSILSKATSSSPGTLIKQDNATEVQPSGAWPRLLPAVKESKKLSLLDANSLGNKTTEFGGNTRYESFHPGIDIANEKGTPIPAMAPGVITDVKTGYKHGDNGFGNTVEETDNEGNVHQYHHLDKVVASVGQPVGRGQPIATMGDSGSTYSPSGEGTGTHLDYRIVDAYNRYVNPNKFIS